MALGPGRPHSLLVGAAIRRAVHEVLEAEGYRAVTVERVCREAKVDRGAVYRRWHSRTEMVFDLVLPRGHTAVSADCGSLVEDLRHHVDAWLGLACGPLAGRALLSLLADMSEDPELLAMLRDRVINPQRDAARDILCRARNRGEVTALHADHLTAQLIGTTLAWTRLVPYPPRDLSRPLTEALIAVATAPGQTPAAMSVRH